MSSTDSAEPEEALRSFFRNEILAAGKRLRAAGKEVQLQPDAALESYYSTRNPTAPVIFRAEEVQIDRIGEFWRRIEREELGPLAEGLQSLSRAMESADQSGEVSPFIYAMF